MAIAANLHLVGVPIQMAQFEVVLPSQHFGPRRKQTPEERLVIAILQDAIECLTKYRFTTNSRYRHLYKEAKLWVLSRETDWPFSFECICGVLDLDADAVRQQLRITPAPGATSLAAAPRGGQPDISQPGDRAPIASDVTQRTNEGTLQ